MGDHTGIQGGEAPWRGFGGSTPEKHSGRAAERLHIASPSLSQQIKKLERELGAALLVRDRRHVELTRAGAALVGDARQILELADAAAQRVRGTARTKLRLGHVSWLPAELTQLLGDVVRLDEWVLPSQHRHPQPRHVVEERLPCDAAVVDVHDTRAARRGVVQRELVPRQLRRLVGVHQHGHRGRGRHVEPGLGLVTGDDRGQPLDRTVPAEPGAMPDRRPGPGLDVVTGAPARRRPAGGRAGRRAGAGSAGGHALGGAGRLELVDRPAPRVSRAAQTPRAAARTPRLRAAASRGGP